METTIDKSTNKNSILKYLKAKRTDAVAFIGLIFVLIFFEIVTGGKLIAIRNMDVLFSEIFSIGLGCVGVLFLMTLGEIDLSLGAILGFTAMFGAFAAKISTGLILPVCLAAGLVTGLINGILCARFRMPSFIVTLGMSFILRGISTILLNGSKGIPYEMSKYDNFTLKIIVFVAVLSIMFILFEYTGLGKKTKAVGSLPEAARQCGINNVKIKTISFIISGVICGLIGYFSLIRSATVSNFTGSGFEFNVLLAMMIGGFSLTGGWTAKFRCGVIGSIIMGIITNGMTLWGMEGLTQQLIKGILFILAVIISFDRKNVAIIK